MNEEIFNAIFWTAFITSGIGCIITLVKQAYKSKCKEVTCCCIKIIRDIEGEVKEDILEMERRDLPEEKKSNV